MQDDDHLYTAFYPSLSRNYARILLLTNDSHNLSDFICGHSREGALCGKCKAGYSAFYHSREITCGKNKHCRFGLIFYILSEILPTVIFFTIIMIFGISFSSGCLSGLVFFSQVIDIFTQDVILLSSHFNHASKALILLHKGHQLIYGLLNLDLFSVYPFCLWKGATIMDILAFKYVTIVTAVALIVLIVITVNSSAKFKECTQVCRIKRKDSSVIHGISTFLIICYSQYTRVSFFILTKTYHQDKTGVQPISLTYYGGLPYFGKEHLPYAIPAIIVTVILVGLPPFCLILYPLIVHIFAFCGISEHPFVNKQLHLFCINRLMPSFDAFQSCYKDKMRFFAGLSFVYRIAAFLVYLYNETTPPVLLAMLFLGIHSTLQPYKLRKHNVINSLIYLDIAIINCLTISIRNIENESFNSALNIIYIQVAFIYLPILSVLLNLAFKLGRRISKYIKGPKQQDNELPCALNKSKFAHVTHTVG